MARRQMVTRSRRPPRPPPKPAPQPRLAHNERRARFVAEYLIDSNATQAAIRAGYSPRTAYSQGHRLLKDVEIGRQIAARQQSVEAKLADRYEITQDRIKRELALLGFSNMLDYGRVDDDGEFHIDLSATDRDQAAAIQGVKSRRTRRTIGEIEIEEHTTELKLAPKREALVDLGKAVGLFRDGVDITVPVRFIVERTERSANRPPADDEEAAA